MVGDVEAAGCDVGSYQQRNFALAELIQRSRARRLIHVAMQGADAEAVLLQRFVQHRHFALAVAEDDRVLQILGVAQQPAQHLALLMRLAADADLELRNADGRGRGPGNFDLLRVVQEGFGDAADFRRHRRGEEQRLPREGNELADALDVGNEAHVEHAIGFVDHKQFDAGQQKAATLGMVEQAAGGCDQDVDAARQLGVLVAERDAADQERDVELLARAIAVEVFLHLGGEFARRFQDQRARHARPRAALLENGEHGQDEGGRLAGAGLGDAEHVTACQHVGDCLFLNGGGGRVAGGRNSGENLVGQSEI